MAKGKEWLKGRTTEELNKLFSSTGRDFTDFVITNEKIHNLIDQVEEPKKAILPPFAADIIREGKTTGKTFANITGNSSIRHWLIQKVDGKWKYFPEREEELMRAWINEMEEEER